MDARAIRNRIFRFYHDRKMRFESIGLFDLKLNLVCPATIAARSECSISLGHRAVNDPLRHFRRWCPVEPVLPGQELIWALWLEKSRKYKTRLDRRTLNWL